jgi:thymidylate synthase
MSEKDLHESGRPLSEDEFIARIKTDKDFSDRFGELGPIYGSGWRDFEGVDQITRLISDIIKNPDSRRLKVSAWQPHKLKDMVLPPCHTDFQIYTRELQPEEFINLMIAKHGMILEGGDSTLPTRAISLMWNQRSVNEKSAA